MNKRRQVRETTNSETELQTEKDALSFYSEITAFFDSTNNVSDRLRFIIKKAKTLTGAKACSLLFHDEPLFEAIRIRSSKKIRRFNFRKGVGIAGWVLENGFPLTVPDVQKDKRFDELTDGFQNIKIESLICIPVKIDNRVIGVLRLINKKNEKPFTDYDMNLLISSATYSSLAIEREFLFEKLKNDELTNLFNIRHLNQVVEMEAERARRFNSVFSLIFMDLDNFKKVNDKFGHLVGSMVLIEVAQLLQRNLRKIDIISRYGGDEFVVILPQTRREASFFVAERLRKTIEKTKFLSAEGFLIRLTASFGVATFPEDAKNKKELLEIADKAMYHGKFLTKNTVFSAKQ